MAPELRRVPHWGTDAFAKTMSPAPFPGMLAPMPPPISLPRPNTPQFQWPVEKSASRSEEPHVRTVSATVPRPSRVPAVVAGLAMMVIALGVAALVVSRQRVDRESSAHAAPATSPVPAPAPRPPIEPPPPSIPVPAQALVADPAPSSVPAPATPLATGGKRPGAGRGPGAKGKPAAPALGAERPGPGF